MPSFDEATTAQAPPEEVWKLLYEPTRFPEWWAGLGSVEDVKGDGFTLYPEGYPDFPMPQTFETRRDGRQAVISCLVSNISFEWRLEPEGAGTRIGLHVEIPEEEAGRLEAQLDVARRSLGNLARLAASS